MVAIYTYEILEGTQREWWTGKVGKPLVLDGITTELVAKSAVVTKRFEEGGEKKVHVEVVYWGG